MEDKKSIEKRVKAACRKARLSALPQVSFLNGDQDWLELCLPLAEDAPSFKEICTLNAACNGVEFRDHDGRLALIAFHHLSSLGSLDEDELLFLCAQLKEALDTYAESRGLAANEVLEGL